MNDTPDIPTIKRNIWIRGLFMLLMALAFQVSATVVCFVTVVQFLIMLLNGTPNARLVWFGRSMGRYLKQIVDFLAFADEGIPFPFNEWPA
jgi:hypothetical protein